MQFLKRVQFSTGPLLPAKTEGNLESVVAVGRTCWWRAWWRSALQAVLRVPLDPWGWEIWEIDSSLALVCVCVYLFVCADTSTCGMYLMQDSLTVSFITSPSGLLHKTWTHRRQGGKWITGGWPRHSDSSVSRQGRQHATLSVCEEAVNSGHQLILLSVWGREVWSRFLLPL